MLQANVMSAHNLSNLRDTLEIEQFSCPIQKYIYRPRTMHTYNISINSNTTAFQICSVELCRYQRNIQFLEKVCRSVLAAKPLFEALVVVAIYILEAKNVPDTGRQTNKCWLYVCTRGTRSLGASSFLCEKGPPFLYICPCAKSPLSFSYSVSGTRAFYMKMITQRQGKIES